MDPLTGGLLAGGGSLLSGILQSRSNNAAIDLAYDMKHKAFKTYRQVRQASKKYRKDELATNNDLAKSGGKTIAAGRKADIGAARDLRNEGINTFRNVRDRNIGTLESGRNRGVDRIGDAVRSNVDTLKPYYNRGTNAMEAYASNLGIGHAPKGYKGLELTPGAQFQLNEGRDNIESGAAGAGGLYSGATLQALERMRNGEVSQDRDNQMGQLFALGSMGQQAGQDIAGQRQWGATGQNAIGLAYNPMITGERSNYGTNAYNVNNNYTNSAIGANDNATAQNLSLGQQGFGNLFGINGAQIGAMTGGANATLPTALGASSMGGDASTNAGLGFASGIGAGVNNALSTYYMMGGQFGQPASNTPGSPNYAARPMPRTYG